SKRIPDLVFSVAPELRRAFLRGYFLGDGTVSGHNVQFGTSSYDIASGLVYCLGSLGVIPGTSELQPDGVVRSIRGAPCITRHKHWVVWVSAWEDQERIRCVWQDHANAAGLQPRQSRRRFKTLDGDLMALPITSIEEVTASNGNVYDFSVEGDENF